MQSFTAEQGLKGNFMEKEKKGKQKMLSQYKTKFYLWHINLQCVKMLQICDTNCINVQQKTKNVVEIKETNYV